MSRKLFTEEQQQLLRQTPYIYSVTETRITLTKEFKELFMTAYKAGESPRKILEFMVLTSASSASGAYGAFPSISVQNINSTGNSMRVMVHGARQPATMQPQMLPNLYPRLMRLNSCGMK